MATDTVAPWSTKDSSWLPATSVTGTGVTSTKGVDRFTSLLLLVDVTLVSGTSPTLNIYLQTLLADGTTWCDIASLTQIVATLKKVLGFVSGGSAEYTVTDASLAAGTVKAMPLGRQIRVKYVAAGTNPVFTVTITVIMLE